MDILEIQTDVEAADEGVFFPFGEDCQIKIAQWGNKKHRKFLRKIYAKHGRKIDAGAISEEQSNSLQNPQWQYIITDWEGILEGGEPLEYSVETVLRLASQKKYDAFFKKIESISKEEENFRVENIKSLGEDLPTI